MSNTSTNNQTHKQNDLNQTALNHRNQTLKLIAEAKQQSDKPKWDMIIAGGGITGAGIAREAARRGLKVLLVERKDYAWGTSSRSSKMVHGGLRYLGQGDYKTTMHSVRERERLLNEAPGLVDETPYVMAHYKGVFPPPWMFNILLRGYDFFAGKRYRKYIKPTEFTKINPMIRQDGLLGVTQFADAVTDDSRLVMRVLHEAQKDGADTINYMSVQNIITDSKKGVKGATLLDELTQQSYDVYAKVVVSATGAWADELRKKINTSTHNKVRPSRGSHIVVPHERLPVEHAYTLMHPEDKRALFIFPWETRTVIGTTDIDHPDLGNDEVGITTAEVDYLLKAGENLFPAANINKADVICSWAGVRPLISSAEDGKKVHPSKEKREHSVWNDKGLITVSGGKLTTFRLIALDVLKECASLLNISAVDTKEDMFRPALTGSLDQEGYQSLPAHIRKRLLGHYGSELPTLLKLATPEDFELIPETYTLWAELRFAAANEQVQHLDDLLLRRTRLGLLLAEGGMRHAERIKSICQNELGWDEAKWQTESDRYRQIWQQYYYLPSAS